MVDVPEKGSLPLAEKLELVARIWSRYAQVRLTVRRRSLPELVAHLRRARRPAPRRYPPVRLSRAVHRSLRLGRRRPTCLVSSLVLFRLLHEQGDGAELVIGLQPEGGDRITHAWVELEGEVVGPPPGRGQHVPLARFG
jgi:Transglutaminase-like superfamily